jgi:formylglycine-generating enzyme required for sulfatase activity
VVFPDPGLIEVEGFPQFTEQVYDNTVGLPAMRIDIYNNAGWSSLSSINFYHGGSYPSIIENLNLWRDDGDEIFEPDNDTWFAGTDSFGATNQIIFSDLGLLLDGYTVIWAVVDLADTDGGQYVDLSVLSYKDIVFTTGEVLYYNFPLTSGTATALASPVELCYVPAGDFKMGSDPETDPYYTPFCDYNEETPPHINRTGDYYISRYEITNAQMRDFIDAGGYSTQSWWPNGWQWHNNNEITEPYGWNTGEYPIGDAYPDHPVGGCSWYEAQAFCTWMGGRLPSEQEWEKAGRGVNGLIYTYGNTYDPTAYATYMQPIGGYPQGDSIYGVADLCGNAFEWVQTSWAWGMYERYSEGSFDPPSYYTYKMHRGYRYLVTGDCDVDYATRMSYRETWPATYRWPANGFRIAFDPPE